MGGQIIVIDVNERGGKVEDNLAGTPVRVADYLIENPNAKVLNRYISPLKELSKDVSVKYVWKMGKAIYMTKKESIVAETFLRTRSYTECERELKREGFSKSRHTCKRWLERPQVRSYIEQELKGKAMEAGWTKGRWLEVMTDHINGVSRLAGGDLYAMKLISDVMNWAMPGQFNFNQEIKVVQADGRE